MNLTESDAGTDLAAIKMRATLDGDAFRIKVQKIYITWGDHQVTPNIVHLVLARLPVKSLDSGFKYTEVWVS